MPRPRRSANGMKSRMVASSATKPVSRSTASTVAHCTGFRETRIVSYSRQPSSPSVDGITMPKKRPTK